MADETTKNLIDRLIKKSWIELTHKSPRGSLPAPNIEIKRIKKSSREEWGDYSAEVYYIKDGTAFLSPSVNMYEQLVSSIRESKDFKKNFKNVEFAKPVFVNFFVSEEYLKEKLKGILRKEKKFGDLKVGRDKKINVEFISANPTGPLTLGNARGGFCGDVLANVLEKAGYEVFREYYVNDIGGQVEKALKLSLEGKEGGYQGPHIDELKKKGIRDPQEAARIILEKWIKPTIKKMGIRFDRYFFESELDEERKEVKDYLEKKKLSFEKEEALWFKSTQFGDDKDRVLIKTDGKQTYILSDIAYLKNKLFKRRFDKLIYFLGAEHHGYVTRLKGGAEALGYQKEQVKPIIFQLVRLLEKGKEVRMSKRKGVYITIDDLLEEINVDVARYFFLVRSSGSHLLFNLDLAKEQSEKNPVYYIQYAHARICSILKKIKNPKSGVKNLELLKHPSELNLIKYLIRFPEIIEDTADDSDYQIQRIPRYAHDLAEAFHQFYRNCRVITEDKKLQEARLTLVLATQIVLKNTLDLMGISTPQKM
jgi:arginyl-tRNA synthetase